MISQVIIAHLYKPGSAATNRIIAYAKSFRDLGVNVSLVLGNESHYESPKIEGVTTVMVKVTNHGKLAKQLAASIKSLYQQGNSAIIVYGSPLLCWYLPKSKFNIFYECTEVPFYGRAKTIGSRIKEGIKIFLAKRATGMLVISRALEQYFRGKGIKNIIIANMFVDTARFTGISATKDEKYVAYCGTISPFKDGVDCLIKAFSFFYKAHPEYNLKIIGRFECDEAENTLRNLVNELSIQDAVCFTGMVKPEEMPRLLCGASMLALARPDNEQAKYGFPTKLGEYLATGKPVVVTRVGEIGDFLSDGVNCRWVEPGDPVAFAEAMGWVADNYQDAIRIGNNGKVLTTTEFSSMKQSKKVISFIESYNYLQ